MKRIRIIHKTEYHYNQPVTFGQHRALLRPREGHDVRIANAHVQIEPKATIRWLRDIESNSVAIITFSEPATSMRLSAEVDVDLSEETPFECLIDPNARSFPFQYAPDEQIDLVPYRLPSYPYEGPVLHDWLRN